MEAPTGTACTGPLLSREAVDFVEPTADLADDGCGGSEAVSDHQERIGFCSKSPAPIVLVHRSPSLRSGRCRLRPLHTSQSRKEVREGKSHSGSSRPLTGGYDTFLVIRSRKKCTTPKTIFLCIVFQWLIGYTRRNFVLTT